MRKNYDIPDEVMDILLKIKKKEGYTNETQTLCQIIREFDKRRNEKEDLDVLIQKMNRIYQTEWKQMLNHVSWLDKNMEVLMELFNSLLVYQVSDQTFLSTDMMIHPWIVDSRELIKDRISHAKQIKESKNRWKYRKNWKDTDK